METKVTKIDETLYTIEQEYVRCFVILGSKKALLIDTGAESVDIRSLLAQITDLPIMLCLSHTDCDHTANIGAFQQIYIHEDEAPCISDYLESEQELIKVQDGYTFDLGDRKLEVIALPGHTPGSIGFLDREKRMFFSGDTVSYGPVYMFEKHRSINAYRKSLLKLKEMATAGLFDRIYPCHNCCPIGTEVIDELLECLEGILSGYIFGIPEHLSYEVEVTPKRYQYLKSSILYK